MVDKYHKTATTLIKGAKTLDRKYYTNKNIFDLELKNIFYKNYLYYFGTIFSIKDFNKWV